MIPVNEIVRWFFFNIVLALIPVILVYAIIWMRSTGHAWHDILKDGEMFIFSCTLTASSIGSLLFDPQRRSGLSKPSGIVFLQVDEIAFTLIGIVLIFLLILSTCLFAVGSYVKLTDTKSENLAASSFGQKSTGIALLTIIFSFISAIIKT